MILASLYPAAAVRGVGRCVPAVARMSTGITAGRLKRTRVAPRLTSSCRRIDADQKLLAAAPLRSGREPNGGTMTHPPFWGALASVPVAPGRY